MRKTLETKEERVEWLKEQARVLGLKLVRSPVLDKSKFDMEAFQNLFQDYSEDDIRVIAVIKRGKVESIRLTRPSCESEASRKKRSESAKKRWNEWREQREDGSKT